MGEARHRPDRVLVTGSAGFIGANFVRHLNEAYPGVATVSLDALTYAGRRENLDGLTRPETHTFIHGDIADTRLVARLLREHRIDTVVHFAAESHVDRSIDGPAEFVRTNVVGTFTLLEAARGYWLGADAERPSKARFHHVSTDEVYGSLAANDPPFRETTPYAPSSPYSASKAGADHLARAYAHTYGLPVTITNCSNNYGPYQHPEKFIPTVLRSAIGRRPIPVYGDGSNIRDWLFVSDHVGAIDLVLREGTVGETYNVGGRNEWANVDIARLICRVLDERRPGGAPYEKQIEFVKDRPGHDWRYAVDTAKIERELRWAPRETFESGIRKTIDWYLAHGVTRD